MGGSKPDPAGILDVHKGTKRFPTAALDSPRHGEKAGYYSTVYLETGVVEWMELEFNSHAGTAAVRDILATPGPRMVNLPDYNTDFNADESIWGWAREEATGNLVLGSKALVQEGRSQTAPPDFPAVSCRRAPARFPA